MELFIRPAVLNRRKVKRVVKVINNAMEEASSGNQFFLDNEGQMSLVSMNYEFTQA